MVRPAALATVLIAFALPAAAQEAGAKLYREPGRLIAGPPSPALVQQATPSDKPLDWSKPVVGVDGNIPNAPAKDAPLPVEVYTAEDLNAQAKKPDKTPKDGAPTAPAVPPHN